MTGTVDDVPMDGRASSEEKKSSSLGAAFNILCTVVGTGLLQLPHGIAQSGWVGVPLLILMSFMACYTAYVIVKCFDYIKPNSPLALHGVMTSDVAAASQQTVEVAVPPGQGPGSSMQVNTRSGLVQVTIPNGVKEGETFHVQVPGVHAMDPATLPDDNSNGKVLSYADIGEAAFGSAGAWFVSVQMHVTLTLVGTIYHLLAAHNLHDLISSDSVEVGSGSGDSGSGSGDSDSGPLSPHVCVLIVAWWRALGSNPHCSMPA